MVVYLDVLIFDNTVLNLSILFAAAKFLHIPVKKRLLFILLSALLGTAYAVVMVFAPPASAIHWNLSKAILSLCMVFTAYYPRTLRAYLKYLLCFYITTFIFAGTAVAIIFMWGQSYRSYNGVLYFSWNSPIKYVAVVTPLGYFLIKWFIRVLQRRRAVEISLVDLFISFDGKGLWLPALVDTGNELRDPLTGRPVVVVEAEQLTALLPEALLPWVKNGELWERGLPEDHSINAFQSVLTEIGWLSRFQMVPFRSLGCDNGMLPGFRPDYIKIQTTHAGTELENAESEGAPANESAGGQQHVIICFYMQKLSSQNDYHALVGTELTLNA